MNKLEWIVACVIILVTFLLGVFIGGIAGVERVEKFIEYVPQFAKDMLATVTAGSAIAYITLRINRRTEARELETRRRNALDSLAGTMFEHRELLMNTSYPVFLEENGTLINRWFGKHEVTIEFEDGHYDRKTKEALYIHQVFLKRNEKEVLRFSFRGEHELERSSVTIHVMPDKMSSTSRGWDDAIAILDNVVGGLIIGEGVNEIGSLVTMSHRKIVRGTVPMASDADRRLKKAVETLNLTEVERAIKDVTSINARDLHGKTFLLCAVVQGGARVKRVIPSEDNKASHMTQKDETEATDAASIHCKIIERIIAAKCDIDAEDNSGISPIIAATNIQNDNVLSVLAANDASIEFSKDINGLNVVQLILDSCWPEGLEIIIDRYGSRLFKHDDYTDLLHLALKKCVERQCTYGNDSLGDRYIETVRILLEAGADIDTHIEDGKTAWQVIIQMSDERLISLASRYKNR